MASVVHTFFNPFLSLLLLVSLSPSLFLQKQHVVVKGEQKPSEIGVRAGNSRWVANVVVAKDGSGNYRSIQEAVDRAPDNSPRRYVIYIKAGWYNENVVVEAWKKNLAFVGDGIGKTVLNSYRSAPYSIFDSAALVAIGDGFYAQDMAFRNSAGPEKGQAVAMRCDSDRSAFFRCAFLGYQDTLLANKNRQFYKQCEIVGTVDFIFGDASVVFQSCSILPRRPLSGQSDVIVAQAKERTNERSGTVIQNCHIAAFENLGPAKTYLARPWKEFSTVIIMKTNIDGFIDPAGFLPAPDRLLKNERSSTFWEYRNTGPGAETRYRVRWPGYRAVYNAAEVEKYTVANFINGNDWLPALGIPYKAGL